MLLLCTLGWLACVIYSTIPGFWLLIHPHADYWRSRRKSPFRVLMPLWMGMWIVVAAITAPWRHATLYHRWWSWIPAVILFCIGLLLYKLAGSGFNLAQLGGLPEVRADHREQRLVTSGIRSRLRHPVYVGHLCEMLVWSIGTGLAVCWALTAFAMITGAAMIRMEDAELEKRFGSAFADYRQRVPALFPRFRNHRG